MQQTEEEDIIICSRCGVEITEENKSSLHEEDIELGIPVLCVDCSMDDHAYKMDMMLLDE